MNRQQIHGFVKTPAKKQTKTFDKDQAVSAKLSVDRGTTDHSALIEEGQ